MYSIKFTGKVSAVNLRYGSAREALEAYRRLDDEDHPNMQIVDNRSGDELPVDELEARASHDSDGIAGA